MSDFLYKGRSKTGNCYSTLLTTLREENKKEDWVGCAKDAMLTIFYLGLELLEHLLNSPDLARSDYHLFPQLKK